METLFDLLQKDFCPPLDSSLIAALLVELESDLEGNTVSPSQDQIDNLYATCRALAQQSEMSQQSEFSGSHILQISSCTTSDYNYEQSSGSGSGSPSSSDLSQHSFGSPLGFLQAALPDVPTTTLRRALLHAKKENIDMWDIVAGILTEKSILEMEEIGFDGLEYRETVKSKKKPSTKAGKKKIQSQPNKIILSDIRQQHHIRPSPSSSTTNITSKRPTAGATPDPWTQISSLSTHIASLLPPHPPSFFLSFFHSPIYTTSYDALRAALMLLCKNKQDAANYTTIVSNIMDILSLDIEDVDHPELKARRTADIRLSVTVADGRATEALDLVNVLRDLDTRPDMGLSHLLPAQVSNSNGGVNPSELKPPSPTSGNKPSPDQWHIVRSSPTTRVHMPTKYLPLLENGGPIDLHGLYVKEAITHAEKSIQLAKSNGLSQVELIVGKGRHSQGGIAKIKPAIEELLIEKHKIVAQSDPNNSGVLIAYLDSSNNQGTGPGYRSSQTRH